MSLVASSSLRAKQTKDFAFDAGLRRRLRLPAITARSSPEKDERDDKENRHENGAGPGNIAEESRHGHARAARQCVDHEIRRIADISERSQEDGADRDRCQCGCERPHELRRMVARKTKEDQISRRVIEDRRQKARRPEVGGIVRGPIGMRQSRNYGAERPMRIGRQHGHHRDDANENRREEFRHFFERSPGEVIGLAVFVGRDRERDQADRQHRSVAYDILQFEPRAENTEPYARMPECAFEDRANGRENQRDIFEAPDLEARFLCLSRFMLLPKKIEVNEEKYRKKQARGQEHMRPQMQQRPKEIDAGEKSEKERRIAERAQRAADVRNEEDNKDHDVNLMPPAGIGL